MKQCIVNFADQHGWYLKGQQRLAEACKKHFNGDFITLNSYKQIGAPNHADNPYAFKIYAMEYAFNLGYDLVLYCDSSLYPVKDCAPVFEHIKNNGHLMQMAGHKFKTWSHDKCREYFKVTPEELQTVELYSAGFTGLNFQNERSSKFFDEWKQSMLDGMFKGVWSKKHAASQFSKSPEAEGYRHDMSAASIIATRLGMNFESNYWMAYVGNGYGPTPPEAYFLCHPA